MKIKHTVKARMKLQGIAGKVQSRFTGHYRGNDHITGYYRVVLTTTQLYRVLHDYRVSGSPEMA